MRYPNALELCRRNLRADPGRFYQPAAGLPLGAGLLVRKCVFTLLHSTEIRYETAEGLGLVLTHECDIDQDNNRFFNDLLLVCPIIPLDDFCEACEQDEGAGAWGGILPQIVSDTVYRAMYLPPLANPRTCPEMEGGGIIYLNHISPCKVDWIPNLPGQAVCSLSQLGLRSFDFKLKNHLFREKDSQLWFTR